MISLFAGLFGLYFLCLLILVYQRKKLGDINSFDKETSEKERRKEAVGRLKARTLEARENDLDEASRNELEHELEREEGIVLATAHELQQLRGLVKHERDRRLVDLGLVRVELCHCKLFEAIRTL